MATVWDKIREFHKNKDAIKSRVMFNWKYFQELEKLMEMVEEFVEKEIVPNYAIDYVNYWNSNLKIKVNNTEEWIERLINCVFKYNQNNDLKYWYIHLEFLVSELSQRTKAYSSGKFLISDKNKIMTAFSEKLKLRVTEI